MPSANLKTPQICYILDEGFLDCTLVSIFSLLQNSALPLDLHIFVVGVDQSSCSKFDRFRQHQKLNSLQIYQLEVPKVTLPGRENAAPAQLGILHIQNHLDGKVIYIDGDTLVLENIGELWSEPLEGNLIGACRDAMMMGWIAKANARHRIGSKKYQKLMARRHRDLPHLDHNNYFNGGVIVFDFDKIAETGTGKRLADRSLTTTKSFVNQDHLNNIIAGRVRILNPKWNTRWGNLDTRRSYFSKNMRRHFAESRKNPAILHFVGKRKPWKPLTKRDLKAALGLQQIANFPKILSFRKKYNRYRVACEQFLDEILFNRI